MTNNTSAALRDAERALSGAACRLTSHYPESFILMPANVVDKIGHLTPASAGHWRRGYTGQDGQVLYAGLFEVLRWALASVLGPFHIEDDQ